MDGTDGQTEVRASLQTDGSEAALDRWWVGDTLRQRVCGASQIRGWTVFALVAAIDVVPHVGEEGCFPCFRQVPRELGNGPTASYLAMGR